MARTNKYTSLNFNHIYDKTTSSTTSSATTAATSSFSSTKSYCLSASSRLTNGGMLVLSRPSSKPLSLPSPTKPTLDPLRSELPDLTISLRPQGKTGPHNPTLQSFPSLDRGKDVDNDKGLGSSLGGAATVKSDKFVPPHLRPGYVPREKTMLPGSGHGSSSNRYLDQNARPKSGGGYDKRMRGGGGESDLGEFHRRPRSGGGDRRYYD